MTRTGSTLLQRALNQCEGFVMYGEHSGLLDGFANAYYGIDHSLIKTAPNDFKLLFDPKRFPATLSCIDFANYRDNMASFVRRTFNPLQIPRWGFKEVRYGRDYHCKVFNLLVDLCPTARFVFLVRNPYEQIQSVRSMRWENFDVAVEHWINQFRYFRDCARLHPDYCRMINYRQLQNIRSLLEWLDLAGPKNFNLFRALPRTGETAEKIRLTRAEQQTIERDCMPLYASSFQ